MGVQPARPSKMGFRFDRSANHLVGFADGVLDFGSTAAKPRGSFQQRHALTNLVAMTERPACLDERPKVVRRRSHSLIEFLEGLIESACLPQCNCLRQSWRTSRIVTAIAVRHLSNSKADWLLG